MILDPQQWRPLAAAHAARADAATAAHLARRARGDTHPVEDFLFEYYGLRPGHLRRWHPGPGIALVDADEHPRWRHYRTRDGITALDVGAYLDHRGDTVRFVRDLLSRTASRQPFFGCFGLHEWAMVYRADENRHPLPLRLGAAGTDAVVEAHDIRCSHFDAFRFFTPEARPRNALQPDRASQGDTEQPGCLHGGAMDLYRWSFKLAPGIPSELLMDCFDLARDARVLDMRSAPYDTSALGAPNIAVETPEGKAEHVRLQRAVAERAVPLRTRLIAACDAILGASSSMC